MSAVDDFDFKFDDPEFPNIDQEGKITGTKRTLEGVEGILIHANWADYDLRLET